MSTYTLLADVNDRRFQSPQELGMIWGEIRDDIERLGAEVHQSHVLIGGYDLQIMFEVDDEDKVLQISMAVQQHGLNTKTMRAMPMDRLGEIANDI